MTEARHVFTRRTEWRKTLSEGYGSIRRRTSRQRGDRHHRPATSAGRSHHQQRQKRDQQQRGSTDHAGNLTSGSGALW